MRVVLCCVLAATPVPDAGITSCDFDELLANEICPEDVPLLLGLKFTFTATVLPGPMLNGRVTPLRLNSVFVVLAADMYTVWFVALRLVTLVEVAPTFTLPKLRLIGLIVRVPGAMPVPRKATETLGALEVTLSVPPTVPAVLGRNLTWKVTLLPAVRVSGNVTPSDLNEPVALTWVILTEVVPRLVTVKFLAGSLLTGTLPKSIVCEEAPKVAADAGSADTDTNKPTTNKHNSSLKEKRGSICMDQFSGHLSEGIRSEKGTNTNQRFGYDSCREKYLHGIEGH